jgi:divalent metal cation (Fe/Co/Zn/Cd) transporter
MTIGATRSSLTRFARLSVVAALATIGRKGSAYLLTGSVGLLSDALESLVNLVAAVVALVVLAIAALSIGYATVRRPIEPQLIDQAGLGLPRWPYRAIV